VEDLRAITSSALGDEVSPLATLPERDNFYELGLVQRFPAGLSLKLSGYRKDSSPGIDDNTVPGSAIVTSVNIAQVRITGIESVLEFRPDGPLSGYANVAINHAYGQGPITGGFFPTDTPNGYFDLDHDQRVSAVVSATYSRSRLFVSGTEIYGSGLTNGVAPEDCGCSYGTGLFAFNTGTKVPPSAIFNASLGYTFIAGSAVVRPQLYIENAFNKQYLLKGVFFSGASVGRPRSVQLRVNVGV
jgi:outer membrane receptor protein involved in Fe transport